jgi:hypothetical protein
MPKENPTNKGPGTWIFKDIPHELMQRTKAGAAIQGKDSVKSLIIELVEEHLQELEKKGLLPKGK